MKKILTIVLLVLLVAVLTGCITGKEAAEQENAMFFVVSSERLGRVRLGQIMVNKVTRVMYWCSDGYNNKGTLTLLVNPDGTPMIWEEDA